jgi:hypothetical protein
VCYEGNPWKGAGAFLLDSRHSVCVKLSVAAFERALPSSPILCSIGMCFCLCVAARVCMDLTGFPQYPGTCTHADAAWVRVTVFVCVCLLSQLSCVCVRTA